MSDAGYQVTHIDQIPKPDGEKEPGERDWHTVVDVPELTWTHETLVVTLPALAVPRSGQ